MPEKYCTDSVYSLYMHTTCIHAVYTRYAVPHPVLQDWHVCRLSSSKFCLYRCRLSFCCKSAGSIVGLGCGITAWLACTKIQYGNLNLDNLQEYAPTLAGAAVAMLVSLFICVLMSLIRPQNYDWAGMKVISVRSAATVPTICTEMLLSLTHNVLLRPKTLSMTCSTAWLA